MRVKRRVVRRLEPGELCKVSRRPNKYLNRLHLKPALGNGSQGNMVSCRTFLVAFRRGNEPESRGKSGGCKTTTMCN
jgi:hypothetical protein